MTTPSAAASDDAVTTGTVSEVFVTFLRLGLTSFGGPVAHIGYFRETFVVRRSWVSEQVFAELFSLAQFLPGPASSQLGFAIGLLRAGWAGAAAAFIGFTLPSVLLLMLFAHLEPSLTTPSGQAMVHGLKLVAVCVIAQALVGMTRQLTPDPTRICVALASAVAALLLPNAWGQLLVLMAGAVVGTLFCEAQGAARTTLTGSRKLAAVLLASFIVLLGTSLLSVTTQGTPQIVGGFYRAGALVFGGGHVVLPLLEHNVVQPDLLSEQQFLAGYGAAQAIPGPMFSFAAYLGMKLGGYGMALACLLAIFLPGFLLLGAALPVWSQLIAKPRARNAVAGINACVVGLLAAAFYSPVCTTALTQLADIAIVSFGVLLLMRFKLSSIWVVVWCVAANVTRTVWPLI